MAHVVFIHGISNKPEALELHRIWLRTLAREENGNEGVDLSGNGIRSSLVYWADVFYESPDEDTAAHESTNEALAMVSDKEIEDNWRDADDAEGQQWIKTMADKYGFEAPSPTGDDEFAPPAAEADGTFERIPLPWFIKRRFMKAFTRDVHHYLFNTSHSPRAGDTYDVQDEIRARFVAGLEKALADGPPLIVVSHSMGTVIAYDCLKRVEACPKIDGLMTIGSPLGIDEIQDKLQPGWTRDDGFPSEKVSGDWINLYDSIDVVARLDPKLRNDYRKGGDKVVSDINQDNSGVWTHSMTKYLAGAKVRDAFRGLLNI